MNEHVFCSNNTLYILRAIFLFHGSFKWFKTGFKCERLSVKIG